MGLRAGLCGRCSHQRVIRNTRGSSFSMCERYRSDSRYPKYPPLPVVKCPGFEEEAGAGSAPASAHP